MSLSLHLTPISLSASSAHHLAWSCWTGRESVRTNGHESNDTSARHRLQRTPHLTSANNVGCFTAGVDTCPLKSIERGHIEISSLGSLTSHLPSKLQCANRRIRCSATRSASFALGSSSRGLPVFVRGRISRRCQPLIPVAATEPRMSIENRTKLSVEALHDLISLVEQLEHDADRSERLLGHAVNGTAAPNRQRGRRRQVMKSELVKPIHLARRAVLYIRQSTTHQVVLQHFKPRGTWRCRKGSSCCLRSS